MIDPLKTATSIAGSGLQAQSNRMRIVSENLANMRSTGATAGSDPYSRKTVQFSAELTKHFCFTALFDNGVQIIGTNDAASKKFRNSRHHPGVLCCPFRERQDSNELPAIANSNDREIAAFR